MHVFINETLPFLIDDCSCYDIDKPRLTPGNVLCFNANHVGVTALGAYTGLHNYVESVYVSVLNLPRRSNVVFDWRHI